MKVRDLLPDEYLSLFETEFTQFQIHETKATCDLCAKAKPQYKKADDYLPHLKCCTFQPFLPNYAVGAILSQTSENYQEAQKVIRSKIKNREYALPIGILPSVKYQVEFMKNKKKIFGRDEDFLCSYYNKKNNSCGIWKYRGSVCTSFYCMSSYGQKGQKFWGQVRNFMSYTEMLLMEEALVHLDFSPREVSKQVGYLDRHEGTASELKTHRMDKSAFQGHWKDRVQDPEGFYIKTYEFVKAFSRKDYLESLGETGQKIQSQLLVQMNLLQKKES
jgi:hypothetical protein